MLELIDIKQKIYEINGKQVMLDSDLAKLYQVETKRINEAVKNNPEKFPERFSWLLTKDEYLNLRSKFATSSLDSYGGRRYLPRVFTEQGVAMLATILKSKVAIKVSIDIMDAFVEMRHFMIDNKNLLNRIITTEYKILEHDLKINELWNKLDNKKIIDQKIFFDSQIYDAYSLLIDLIVKANNQIIIIDNYIDKSILDMLSYKNKMVDVLLVTKQNKLTSLDIDKFNSEYPFLSIIENKSFHDRFLIIDEELYHIGASLKDLGKKCFGITKIKDVNYLNMIKNKINLKK